MDCPKCGEDISESYEDDDPSVGITGGWYCEACDYSIAEWEVDREPMPDDVPISFLGSRESKGTPLPELGTQPGQPGWEEFCRIARSWGYD